MRVLKPKKDAIFGEHFTQKNIFSPKLLGNSVFLKRNHLCLYSVLLNSDDLHIAGLASLKTMQLLWNLSPLRICADGGYHVLNKIKRDSHNIPTQNLDMQSFFEATHILGDLDSIDQNLGQPSSIQIIEDSNQNKSDLEKSVDYALKKHVSDKVATLVIFGTLSGRLDHALSIYHVLYSLQQTQRAIFITPDGWVTLIPNSTDGVKIHGLHHAAKCGLFAIGHPVNSITTSGLQWDLKKSKLKLGECSSIANQINSKVVQVTTSDPVLFCISFKK